MSVAAIIDIIDDIFRRSSAEGSSAWNIRRSSWRTTEEKKNKTGKNVFLREKISQQFVRRTFLLFLLIQYFYAFPI